MEYTEMTEEKRQLFRIGELSKIFHLPVKTLRYYSDIGLLVPAFTDPDSGYRYYSVDQFVLIDVIRNSRRMGMSLEEIGAYLKSNIEIGDIVGLLDTQIDVMEQKMKEYRLRSDSMRAIRSSIAEAMSRERDVPYISLEQEQYYRSYPYRSTTMEEQELNFRTAALSGGENGSQVYSIYGTSTLREEYCISGKMINPDIRSFGSDPNEPDVQVLPAGRYAGIVFDDNVHNKEKYYSLLATFISRENLRPIGDFVEEWIVPRVQDGKESTLIKIKIQIED